MPKDPAMNTMTNLHLRRPVSIRPVSAQGLRTMTGDRRATHATATANFLYITRSAGADDLGTLDYRHRKDLLAQGMALPVSHPRWAEEPGRIWKEADAAMAGMSTDAIRAWHIVVTLPADATPETWKDMVGQYAMKTIARHGPAVAWAIHASQVSDAPPPHAHLLMTTRSWRHDARHGSTVLSWCGPAMTATLHADWLAQLPPNMQVAAAGPFRSGDYIPAHPDCSALEALIHKDRSARATARQPDSTSATRPPW